MFELSSIFKRFIFCVCEYVTVLPFLLLMEHELYNFLSIYGETKHLFIIVFNFTVSMFLPTKLTS